MLPALDGRSWLGTADAYGEQFVIQLWESKDHPGYYHFSFACLADNTVDYSKRPVNAKMPAAIEGGLSRSIARIHGLTLNDFTWSDVRLEDLPYDTSEPDYP